MRRTTETHARNPRLTARPRRPFRPVAPGQTRVGEGLQRGGYLFVPQSYREDTPAPLIVALHGGGGHAGRWSDLYASCERAGVILAAPDSRGRTWDRVTGAFGPDVAFIDALMRYTFERCVIDPTRVALVGFSDGASYTLSLGPSNGDLFTHLMAWSPGFSDPEAPIVGQPNVFISHGSEDRVLPVRLTRSGLVPMFEMDGYDVTYLEFAGRHELTDEVVQESFDWFLGG
ncbi:MAG: phospholipase [Gemmatimonadota bacterium]|nr:phospholipase [Gemmatimonadota bacterium]MDE3004849.1 phospholipase [Gemmatimonadota bacterium]MDE3014290.1 phospholipase [Gemmatimonadota bacterium]